MATGKQAEAMKEAIAIEAEALDGVEAARAEQQRGQPKMSFDLLIDAIGRERESLDLLEQAVETLHQSLESRRDALEKQEELLEELMKELKEK